jgi:hypothetical protein
MREREPRRVEQLPPADRSRIGALDGRGRVVNHLYACTVATCSGTQTTIRFGATDLEDAKAGAEEFARMWFEEIAREYLEYVPDARPHPDDATVRIALVDDATEKEHSFDYPIPAEFQPNSELPGSSAFYRI